MWFLIAREPYPDAEDWPGRKLLAIADALGWPVAWVVFVQSAPVPTGIVGPFVVAMALLCALGRVNRALFAPHRYRFTTWRWGRLVAAMLLVGWVMKLALPG